MAFDGLVLSLLTLTQLDVVLDRFIAWEPSATAAGVARRGRPRSTGAQLLSTQPAVANASIRKDWRDLRRELRDFTAWRRKHHSRMNRTRRGAFRSQDSRDACRASGIGQAVDTLGLFSEFFDTTKWAVDQMAAWMIHRLEERRVRALIELARATALKDLSRPDWNASYQRRALQAELALGRLGSWRTLYRKLSGRKRAASSKNPTR